MTDESRKLPPRPPQAGVFWQTLVALSVGFSLPTLACFGLMIVAALSLQIASLGGSSGLRPDRGVGPAVAVIRVEGVIVSGSAGPFDSGGVAASGDIVRHIDDAAQNGDVRAILLIVDSPGGGVVASDEIHHALTRAGKPIVVLMGDLAASGGYYVSMAADWIIANPNTLTGSIGVISQFPSAEGLLDKIGVEFMVITSGPRKDFGSPYREMTRAERAYWQTIIDETHADFVDIVAEGRGLSRDEVQAFADGGVFTGRQALDLGMVDALGYREDAVAKAAELGGISGQPRLIEYRNQPTFFELLSQTAGGPPSLIPTWAEVAELIGHPRLELRWIGP